MTPKRRLAQIPDELLQRHQHPTLGMKVSRRLNEWLAEHDLRPTLHELEEERARRKEIER